MSSGNDQPGLWNEQSQISCQFAFKCPKTWDRLTITGDPNTRHCGACDSDVHLVLTEAEFNRQAGVGQCVAVRLSHRETAPAGDEAHIVGNLASWADNR
jgi:hypothetical protein